jgi:acyl-CoA reductase-like NAD-dependent aldehyde dehydrogenase
MEAKTTETPSAGAANGPDSAAPGTPGTPEAIEVRRPTDGSLIRTIEVDTPERVADVVARVRANQPAWEALGIEGRYRWLGRLRDWLIDNADEVADLLKEETGKVRADAELEAPYVAGVINFYGEHGAEYLAEQIVKGRTPMTKAKRLTVAFRPFPVVGAISPWNFPVILGLEDLIAAMTAGSAAVLKASEFTPLTTMRIIDAWKHEIGGPDVLDYVNGLGETGGALIDEVDYLQFTGSERTGKVVMRRAADTLTPVSLELGGKDPAIVLADADIERAVNGTTWGGLVNTGQICMSLERIYVEEPIYDEFVNRLAAKVRDEVRQGDDGSGHSAEIGAMTSPNQIAIVSDHVEDARAAGARILTGGRARDGAGDWYEPTVIADADHSMKVMREETFGPVIPVMKVADEEEAVRLANDTTYGLSASVFSGDVERAERVAKRIEAGSCNVNDVMVNYFAVEVPMGGWKTSGIGYRHGAYGIQKFVRSSSIVSPKGPVMKSELTWFPYTNRRRRFVNRLFRLLNARGLRNRLGL